MYNIPYQAESAQPMSAQQQLAQKGVGPLGGGQPGPRRSVTEGGDEPRDTSPTRVYDTSDYARTAPALSSAQLGALGERRRLAEEQYQQTLAKVARNEAIYTADAERRRSNEESLSTRFIQDSMRDLAGRGTARAPMFAGRMVRAANQDLQMKWGEIDSNLGIEMAALKSLVDEALSRKETELAVIEQDRASMRSNLDAIFAAASMYGGM